MSLNIWGDMKAFEDDQLMVCKPREKALLSHREVYVLAKLFAKMGVEDRGLGQVNHFEPLFSHF